MDGFTLFQQFSRWTKSAALSWGCGMSICSAETEGWYRGSSSILSPIKEFCGDRGRKTGQIDVVIQPWLCRERRMSPFDSVIWFQVVRNFACSGWGPRWRSHNRAGTCALWHERTALLRPATPAAPAKTGRNHKLCEASNIRETNGEIDPWPSKCPRLVFPAANAKDPPLLP